MSILVKNKKSIIVFSIFTAFIIFGVWLAFYLHSSSNIISLDVNPSIEIHTNRLGQVVSVDAINEDAKTVLAGYQLSDKNLENVIGDIVDRLILNGYLTTVDTNEILISADKSVASNELLGKVNTVINDYLQQKQLEVGVVQQTTDIDDETLEAAHENNVSVGKMAIINKLMELSDKYTTEELTDASIKQLMTYFADLNITPEELIKEYALIESDPASMEAAQIITKATAGMEQNTITSTSITPSAVDTNNDVVLEKNTTQDLASAGSNDSSDNVAVAGVKVSVGGKKSILKHAADTLNSDVQSEDNNNDSSDIEETDNNNKYDTDNEDQQDNEDVQYEEDSDRNEGNKNDDADYEDASAYEKDDSSDHEYENNNVQNEDSDHYSYSHESGHDEEND